MTKDSAHENGYFTVEAALLFPCIMLFTVMMMFLAFYTYDRCILDHSAYQASIYAASNQHGNAEKVLESAKLAAAHLANDRVFAFKEFDYDVSVKSNVVKVTYNCVVNMPFKSWLANYATVTDDDMSLTISQSAKRIRPARILRKCRVVNDVVSKLKE